MSAVSLHIAVVVRRPASRVYALAADPDLLPRWASGLAEGLVTRDGEALLVDSPMGRVRVVFAPLNPFGVLDHDVTLPDGTVAHNPMRVLAHPEGAEVVFTFRSAEGMGEDGAERDAATVRADLDRLKTLAEETR